MTSGAPTVQVGAETDIVLRDGSTVHVRPVDARGRAPPARLPRFAVGRVALVSLLQRRRQPRRGGAQRRGAGRRPVAARAAGPEGTVVGHGTYICGAARPGGGRLRGRRRLARPRDRHRPARASRACRVARGHRDVHGDRPGVQPPHAPGVPRLRVPGVRAPVEGAIEIEFPTSLSRDARRRFEERQRAADVAAVAHVLRPASVAVIGASRRPGRSAARSCATCSPRASRGRCTSSTSRGGEVAGRPTVRTIADVEGDVELAVIAVPGGRGPRDRRASCAAKGVRALVVLTAGFAEVGPAGRARQDELLAVCRAAGMRMVGPNCLGVANLHHRTALNATFAPGAPTPGNVAFASQSGGVRDRGDRRGGGARHRALVVRLDGRQGRPLRQRLPRVLGAGPRHSGRCCSTWSRSATRAGSGGSRGGSPRRKPIVAVKSGRDGRPAGAPRRRTPARCSRRPT